eukprot:Platyproteum_vivax@DN6686_c0_g1_i2.p1
MFYLFPLFFWLALAAPQGRAPANRSAPPAIKQCLPAQNRQCDENATCVFTSVRLFECVCNSGYLGEGKGKGSCQLAAGGAEGGDVIETEDTKETGKNMGKNVGGLAMESATKTVYEVLTSMPKIETFKLLIDSLEANNSTVIAELKNSENELTVFVPTDKAFAALPNANLFSKVLEGHPSLVESVLKAHIVPYKAYPTTDLCSLASKQEGQTHATLASMLENHILTFGMDGSCRLKMLSVNGYKIAPSNDIAALNGFVHLFEGIMMPEAVLLQVIPTTVTAAIQEATEPSLNTFYRLLQKTGLFEQLAAQSAEGKFFTIFAPSDEAWDRLNAELNLSYHIIEDMVLNEDKAALKDATGDGDETATETDEADKKIYEESVATMKRVLQYHVVPEIAVSCGQVTGQAMLTSWLAGNTGAIILERQCPKFGDCYSSPYCTLLVDEEVKQNADETTMLRAKNGFVHIIPQVLVPEEVQFAVHETDPKTNAQKFKRDKAEREEFNRRVDKKAKSQAKSEEAASDDNIQVEVNEKGKPRGLRFDA